jgi:hypothetical protein
MGEISSSSPPLRPNLSERKLLHCLLVIGSSTSMRFVRASSGGGVEGASGVQMLVELRAWCASMTSGTKSGEKTELGVSS